MSKRRDKSTDKGKRGSQPKSDCERGRHTYRRITHDDGYTEVVCIFCGAVG